MYGVRVSRSQGCEFDAFLFEFKFVVEFTKRICKSKFELYVFNFLTSR